MGSRLRDRCFLVVLNRLWTVLNSLFWTDSYFGKVKIPFSQKLSAFGIKEHLIYWTEAYFASLISVTLNSITRSLNLHSFFKNSTSTHVNFHQRKLYIRLSLGKENSTPLILFSSLIAMWPRFEDCASLEVVFIVSNISQFFLLIPTSKQVQLEMEGEKNYCPIWSLWISSKITD